MANPEYGFDKDHENANDENVLAMVGNEVSDGGGGPTDDGTGDTSAQYRSQEIVAAKGREKAIAARQAGVKRTEDIERRKEHHFSAAVVWMLLIAGAIVPAVIDYGYIENLLKLPEAWTWVVVVAIACGIVGVAHYVVPKLMGDVDADRQVGPTQWGAVIGVVIMGGIALAYTGAASWARARALDAFFGADSSPGFNALVIGFVTIQLLLLGAAVFTGSADVKLNADAEAVKRRKVKALEALRETTSTNIEIVAAKWSRKMQKLGLRQKGKAPKTPPELNVDDIVTRWKTWIDGRIAAVKKGD